VIFSFQHRFPHLASLWEKYTAMQQLQTIPAKTILLHEGKIAKNYYFVEQGCLRLWFNNDGKDVTFQFFFENEGVASLESFQKNIPSIFTIETVEPTTVKVLSKEQFNQMIAELRVHPEFQNALLEMSMERQLHYVREFMSRLRDTPRQRYENLLQEKPHIIRRIPQHYIASYLGITSVHLSRIKSRLTKGSGKR
jgi:CRP-like cAMP-binding protein